MKNKILLVDDEIYIVKALSRLLERNVDDNYQIFKAYNGAEALRQMQRHNCQVVISDFRMPDMTGADLLQQIKKQFPHTIGLILSGHSDSQTVLEILNKELAFRFLVKPWDERVVLNEISAAFSLYRSLRDQAVRDHQLISSKAALAEIDHDWILLRANGSAEKLMQHCNDNQTHQNTDFKRYLSEQQKKDLLSGVFVEYAGFEKIRKTVVELSLHYKDQHAMLLKLRHIGSSNVVLSEDMPVLLGHEQLVHQIDQLLLSDTPFVVAAIRLKNYAEWAEIQGFRDADIMLSTVSIALQTSINMYGGTLGFPINELFILILPAIQTEIGLHEQLSEIIRPVISCLGQNHSLSQPSFTVSYCMAPADGNSGRELISNAQISNRLQLGNAVPFYSRYSAQLAEKKRQQLRISDALYRAVELEQLELYYQPKFDVINRRFKSVEALVRWQHPELGMVSPNLFIPIAEQYGQIAEIGLWVLRQACISFPNLSKMGIERIAVNISGLQLQQPDFVESVIGVISQSGIHAQAIELELTESAMLTDLAQSKHKLEELRTKGLTVALDDFGTGYSSLAILAKLPVDTLKIDKSLISDLDFSLSSLSIVSNICRMAREMGLKIVIEGVETTEQLAILNEFSCDEIQGYLYCKPLPIELLAQQLKTVNEIDTNT